MKIDKFEKIVDNQIYYCRHLLVDKGKEYAGGDDRLNAFKVAAKLQNISAKEALCGMMAKHTFSIYEMCFDKRNYSIDKWTEKITDHINYLLLLKAIVEEEGENVKN